MIELSGINRIFYLGGQPVYGLRDVNLSIKSGEYISVMGPSGSGKSTLLNILGLLDKPDNGHYRLNDTESVSLTDNQRAHLRLKYIGFVFQTYHLIPRLSARENIELPLMLAGIPAKKRHQKADIILEKLNLKERAHHNPSQLSGGQRQRVVIARALITEPEILLADEPTGNLDTVSGEEVIKLLEALNRQGITLLVVTHDQHIGQRARRHLTMVDGMISMDTNTPCTAYDSAAHDSPE